MADVAVKSGPVAVANKAKVASAPVPDGGATAKSPATTKSGLPALPKLPKSKKAKPPRECECGCKEMTQGGRFIAGHDGRLKGLALRVERKVMSLEDVEAWAEQIKTGTGKSTRAAVQRLLAPAAPQGK